LIYIKEEQREKERDSSSLAKGAVKECWVLRGVGAGEKMHQGTTAA
jgi:hypothetical protein